MLSLPSEWHTDYLALTVTSVLWWHDFPFISLTGGVLSQYLTVLGWTFHVPTISPPTHSKNIINLNLIAWVFATNECCLNAVFCWPPAQPFQSLMTLVLTYSFSLPCPVFLLGKLNIRKEDRTHLTSSVSFLNFLSINSIFLFTSYLSHSLSCSFLCFINNYMLISNTLILCYFLSFYLP